MPAQARVSLVEGIARFTRFLSQRWETYWGKVGLDSVASTTIRPACRLWRCLWGLSLYILGKIPNWTEEADSKSPKVCSKGPSTKEYYKGSTNPKHNPHRSTTDSSHRKIRKWAFCIFSFLPLTECWRPFGKKSAKSMHWGRPNQAHISKPTTVTIHIKCPPLSYSIMRSEAATFPSRLQ